MRVEIECSSCGQRRHGDIEWCSCAMGQQAKAKSDLGKIPFGKTAYGGTAMPYTPGYFAHKIFDSSGKEVYHPSRRDYFAAAALQGVLNAAYITQAPLKVPPVVIVADAVYYADATIAELDKEKK